MVLASSAPLPFRWVIVRALACPEIAAGHAPPGLLAPVEQAILERLRFVRRRRKWLLGRWAAKSLLQDVETLRTGSRPDASALLIFNEPSGAPYAAREPEGRLPISISISHREDRGVAGVSLVPAESFGIDIETIEARGSDWCADYFVAHEMDAVRAAGEARDRVVATIWSAKESALKALGVGLRMDPRRVEVRVASSDRPTALEALDSWMPLDLKIDPEKALGRTVRAYSMESSDHVLTAVLLTGAGQEETDSTKRYFTL